MEGKTKILSEIGEKIKDERLERNRGEITKCHGFTELCTTKVGLWSHR